MAVGVDADGNPTLFGVPIKFLVCCLLVVQNGGAVLLMRSVRALPGEKEFVTQTAVIMQECLKACTCMAVMKCQQLSVSQAWGDTVETMKTSVPALLYLVQNNLQYVAVGLLDAPTYAVTYQTKVFWVAICSAVFLGRQIKNQQWFALMILMGGVCAVQYQPSTGGKDDASQSVAMRATGVCMLLGAALCSSLAAVSFEKLLKGSNVDMWTRNLQLAFFSIICSAVPLLLSSDGSRILEVGFFHGYTPLTWTCIAMNAWGGLLVGAVIKYADAILKDISIGASICVSAGGSVFLFNAEITWNLVIGIVFVSWAVPLYAGRASLGLFSMAPPPETKAYKPVAQTEVVVMGKEGPHTVSDE